MCIADNWNYEHGWCHLEREPRKREGNPGLSCKGLPHLEYKKLVYPWMKYSNPNSSRMPHVHHVEWINRSRTSERPQWVQHQILSVWRWGWEKNVNFESQMLLPLLELEGSLSISCLVTSRMQIESFKSQFTCRSSTHFNHISKLPRRGK